MQIMDQIEGVNAEMLPWEGERLTPQARFSHTLDFSHFLGKDQLLHWNQICLEAKGQICHGQDHINHPHDAFTSAVPQLADVFFSNVFFASMVPSVLTISGQLGDVVKIVNSRQSVMGVAVHAHRPPTCYDRIFIQ
jgi:hypothetical protein